MLLPKAMLFHHRSLIRPRLNDSFPSSSVAEAVTALTEERENRSQARHKELDLLKRKELPEIISPAQELPKRRARGRPEKAEAPASVPRGSVSIDRCPKWNAIWWHVQQRQPGDIRIHKVDAHKNWSQIEEGRLRLNSFYNDVVDKL